MSVEKDVVAKEHLELLEHVEFLFDRVYMLAGRIACIDSIESLPDSIMEEVEDLEGALQLLPRLSYRFSGRAFVPAGFPNGEVDTIFTDAHHNVGTFAGLNLAEGEEFEYIEADEFAAEVQESDTDVIDAPETQTLRERMQEPASEVRLYVDFLINHDPNESPISGSSVRAAGVNTYATVDAETLVVHGVDRSPPKTEVVHEEDLPFELSKQAARFRKLMQSPGFRYAPTQQQEAMVDDALEHINELLQVDKFEAWMQRPEFYTVQTVGKLPKVTRVVPEEACAGFSLAPIRVDSLYNLTKDNTVHQQKRVIDPRAGLCLVGTISDSVRELFQLDSLVIWIPVTNNMRNDGAFAAHFEEQGSSV